MKKKQFEKDTDRLMKWALDLVKTLEARPQSPCECCCHSNREEHWGFKQENCSHCRSVCNSCGWYIPREGHRIDCQPTRACEQCGMQCMSKDL